MSVINNNFEHRVAIVVDREFGSQLPALATRLHVWICDTPTNRRAVEEIWKITSEQSIETGATLFTVRELDSSEQMVLGVLEDVDLHHGEYSQHQAWSVVEVYGCDATERLKSALARHDADVTQIEAGYFLARRELPEPGR